MLLQTAAVQCLCMHWLTCCTIQPAHVVAHDVTINVIGHALCPFHSTRLMERGESPPPPPPPPLPSRGSSQVKNTPSTRKICLCCAPGQLTSCSRKCACQASTLNKSDDGKERLQPTIIFFTHTGQSWTQQQHHTVDTRTNKRSHVSLDSCPLLLQAGSSATAVNKYALPGEVPDRLDIDMEGEVLPAQVASQHAAKYATNVHPVSEEHGCLAVARRWQYCC